MSITKRCQLILFKIKRVPRYRRAFVAFGITYLILFSSILYFYRQQIFYTIYPRPHFRPEFKLSQLTRQQLERSFRERDKDMVKENFIFSEKMLELEDFDENLLAGSFFSLLFFCFSIFFLFIFLFFAFYSWSFFSIFFEETFFSTFSLFSPFFFFSFLFSFCLLFFNNN